MNSPRKYSSPYLTTIPGLTPSTNRLKKRSRTSIVKVNESGTHVQAESNKTATNGSVSTNPSKDHVQFDASCGDVDQAILKDIKAVTKSIDASHGAAAKQIHEALALKIIDGNSNPEGATAIASASNESVSVTQNDSEGNFVYSESTESKVDDSRSTVVLKSILKKPIPYRDKSTRRLDFTNNNDTSKKTAKSPKVKNGRTSKETKEPLSQVRALVKHKLGTVPISPSRTNAQQRSAQAQPSKSPRRKAKGLSAKADEKPVPEVLPVSKKSVRFSNKVEVYAVPYESRAGTRACDWQRNMLEQRMQAFRQLMKDVNTDELDFMGNGMLFPGFSFPAANQNMAVRGRGVRNFSNFKL
ncbi:unnamed protein product [Orchesella dallaii]|uniref:Uncharacterized protein n=1 Tax=Orchesella dallaii TaxID=48710 RepID=A0ABP1S5D7_9HEXA